MNLTNNYGAEPNYVHSWISETRFKDTEKPVDTGKHERKLHVQKLSPLPKKSDYLEHETHAITFADEVRDKDCVQAMKLWEIMSKQDGVQDRFVQSAAAHVAACSRAWFRDDGYGENRLHPLCESR